MPGSPIAPPIVQSATFVGGDGSDAEILYTRYGNNPNHRQLAGKLARLEGTEDALVLSSGMAATAMTFLALAGEGDHVLAARDLYGTTKTLLSTELPRRGIEATFVGGGDPDTWRAALRPETRIVFAEVPSNPTLRVLDLPGLASLAHDCGALFVVDATFASPANLRPSEHGADVVIQSATKYLGGHSDLVAGSVAASAEIVARVTKMLKLYGPALDPHAVWLLDRGIRTLAVRIGRHNENALGLARWLESHPGVDRVVYPGLESHPDHALASRLLDGFGGMLAFVSKGGGAGADRFVNRLRLAYAAPSLGGVETLVSQPRHTSHIDWDAASRDEAGIPDGFVRVSTGIEDLQDLIADFAQALDS